MRSLHIDLIDGTQGFGSQYFDIIENYPVENTNDKKSILFHVDFANTMANIGKMLSGSYRTGSFVKPVTPVMIEYNSKQNLNSFPDAHHIKNGINYAFEQINWNKVNSNNKSVINEYENDHSANFTDKVKSWFRK